MAYILRAFYETRGVDPPSLSDILSAAGLSTRARALARSEAKLRAQTTQRTLKQLFGAPDVKHQN